MQQVKCSSKNILETSSVSLSAGTEDSNYPLYRVYDRDIGKMFKLSAAVTMEIRVYQSTPIAIDRLLIPAGHNLDGMTLDWQYSSDDVSYTPAVTQWVQSGNNLIDKSISTATYAYWKFIITSPASIPEIPEIFMSPTYTWEQNPSLPSGPVDSIFNVEQLQTAGGHDRFLIHGNAKKQRNYQGYKVETAQKDNVLALNEDWAGAKPFWLCDHDGTWIYGMLDSPVRLIPEDEYDSGGYYTFDFQFREVIG